MDAIANLRSQLEVKGVELWEARCATNAAIADADKARAERDAAIRERDALADELARMSLPAPTGR